MIKAECLPVPKTKSDGHMGVIVVLTRGSQKTLGSKGLRVRISDGIV